MSAIAADILSKISPSNIVTIGLDIEYVLVRDSVEMENLVRLAEVLKTRGFTRLRRIHVRVEYNLPKYSFREVAQILRRVFPENLLTMESIPHEKGNLVKDPTDDCIRL